MRSGICQSINRKADETQRQFENRIHSRHQFRKETRFEKVLITQNQMANIAVCYTVAFCAITRTAKKITAG